jgi:1-phosphofructokinase
MIYTVTLNPSLDRTIHYPTVSWGAVNRATRSSLDLSGKGVNISIALRQLGCESVMLGFSAGVFGRLLVEGLGAHGYRCEFVEIAGETRSNITLIEDDTGRTTKLNEAGPPVTARDLAALEERLCALLAPGDMVALAGSLPPDAPDDTYARLIDAAHRCGARVALDSSGPALAAGCRAAPDLVKPNLDEAQALVGCPVEADLVWALCAMREMGPRRVLLSLGKKGAVYADDSGYWLATPPAIAEVNNVGAGDAALAGAICAWDGDLSAAQMVRWAVAAGTATAQTDGTTFPGHRAIQSVYEQVLVERLAD